MIAVEFRLKLSSAYSIRVPYSYQCARTYPLPTPSTIKGLCANALWRNEEGNPIELLKAIHGASLGATARAEKEIAVTTCTVRVIPMNALLRQFAFTPYVDCMIVFSDGNEALGKKISDALKTSPVYLGDSESLVCVLPESVIRATNIVEFKEGDDITVNSLVKFDFLKDRKVNAKGTVLYMQEDPCADDATLERYLAPLKQEGDSYVPLDSISFTSSKRGHLVRGNKVQGVFCDKNAIEQVIQKPKLVRKKRGA